MAQGAINPKYLGQYVSAISTVAQWFGDNRVESFRVTSSAVRRVLRSALLTTVDSMAVD